jgi:hypothetical protein
MPFALNLYHDQIGANGSSAPALAPAPRLLYVRHGRAALNGQAMSTGQSLYSDGPLDLQSAGEWSQVWRWELASPDAAPALHQGKAVLSSLRMSRVITSIGMMAGTRWIFRLDQIIHGGEQVADRHQHPGPGIRCLLEGTFNVQQAAESARNLGPGDAWWETGSDTVVAWGSRQMPARFLRGMVLPAEWQGKVTGTWLSGGPPPGQWELYIDQVITV